MEEWILKELLESQAFCTGILFGMSLYEQKVIMAHEKKQHLRIGENLYYIQDGRERLQELMDKICK